MGSNKSNRSHQAILASAKNLFWKHGIRRVTVEEISKEASVSKMTFYRLFKNKSDVAKHVMQRVLDENVESYRKIMGHEIPFTEKINQLIKLKYEGTLDMSQEFFSEVYQLEELELKEMMLEYQKKHLNEFIDDLQRAQNDGYLKSDIKPEFILYILNKINEMLMDEKLLSMYRNTHEAIMALTNFFFFGIIQQRD